MNHSMLPSLICCFTWESFVQPCVRPPHFRPRNEVKEKVGSKFKYNCAGALCEGTTDPNIETLSFTTKINKSWGTFIERMVDSWNVWYLGLFVSKCQYHTKHPQEFLYFVDAAVCIVVYHFYDIFIPYPTTWLSRKQAFCFYSNFFISKILYD